MVNIIDTEKYTVFSDIPGHTAAGVGSVPPEICITAQKPVSVILEKSNRPIHFFNVHVPLNRTYRKTMISN